MAVTSSFAKRHDAVCAGMSISGTSSTPRWRAYSVRFVMSLVRYTALRENAALANAGSSGISSGNDCASLRCMCSTFILNDASVSMRFSSLRSGM